VIGVAEYRSSSRQLPSTLDGARGAAVLVWTVWALTLAAALLYVMWFGHNIPIYDDFTLVPYLAGDKSPTAAWLWEPHNEHHIPLPKLVLVSLLGAGGGDFRTGMFFNVLGLGALAFAMIYAARRLRGRTSLADAFFPLILLHGGHTPNYLFCFTAHFVLVTVFAGGLLLVVVLRGAALSAGAALLLFCCLVALALCGLQGLVFVPASALWLCYSGVVTWRAGDPARKRHGLLMALLGLAACFLVALPLIDYGRPHGHPPSNSLWDSVRTAVQFLSMCFGNTAWRFWQSGGLLMVALAVISSVALVRVWRKQPREGLRALGILAFLAGAMGLAVGVGWGRAGGGYLAGLQMRFVTLTAPMLCCLYFAWELYSPPAITPWPRAGLLALSVVIFVLNVPGALTYGSNYDHRMAALERDLHEGVPPYRIVNRYAPNLWFTHDGLNDYLGMLRHARIGAFRDLRSNPPFREVVIPADAATGKQMTWDRGAGEGVGPDSLIEFRLPDPCFVAGIRMTYSHTNRDGISPVFRLSWDAAGPALGSEDGAYESRLMGTGPADHTETVWVSDTLAGFRIRPDERPCVFRLSQVVLLLPAGEEETRPRAGP
jgi:hypothetical protein